MREPSAGREPQPRHSLFWLLDHYPETGESIAALHRAALDEAELADRLGFASLWIAEHHFQRLSTVPNPAVLLAAVAQRTEAIRLGPATAVLPLHHPIRLVEDYALVDVLSGGRLDLGVGSGSAAEEFRPLGVDFATRKERFATHLAAIRRRWRAAATGDVGPSSINVTPIQSPTPPIYVATLNEDTAFEVGRAGDSLLTLVPPSSEGLDAVAARVQAHARGLEDAGRPADAAEAIVMVFAHIAESEGEAAATAVPALARLLRAMTGSEPPEPDAFYERMRADDAGLFGTPEAARRQLRRFAERGIHHLAFVSRFGGMSPEAARRSLRLLSQLGGCRPRDPAGHPRTGSTESVPTSTMEA